MSAAPQLVPNAPIPSAQPHYIPPTDGGLFDLKWLPPGEAKWIYLVAGVLIAILLLVVIGRPRSRPYVARAVPSYPVPAYRLSDGYRLNAGYADGRRVGGPAVVAPDVRFPTQPVERPLPVYVSGPGGQVMPYVNRTDRDKVVTEATFIPRGAGRPLIPGAGISAYEIRFGPADFDVTEGRWRRAINDLTLPAASQTLVVVHLVDPSRTGEQIYGTLILGCADGELIEFESSKVVILPE
jgi:hypothetical protein